MKNRSNLWIAAIAAAALMLTGCEKPGFLQKKQEPVQEAPAATPTPLPTPTPAPTPTPTPTPMPTRAPRLFGVKTASSRKISLTNTLPDEVRRLYIRISGSGDWTNNLIPEESTIKKNEEVSLCYTPENGDNGPATFDIRIYTKGWDVYDIYSVNLEDMDRAILYLADSGLASLRYTSKSENKEATTDPYDTNYMVTEASGIKEENTQEEIYDDSSWSDDSSYNQDDYYYEETYPDYEDYYGDYDDGGDYPSVGGDDPYEEAY